MLGILAVIHMTVVHVLESQLVGKRFDLAHVLRQSEFSLMCVPCVISTLTSVSGAHFSSHKNSRVSAKIIWM